LQNRGEKPAKILRQFNFYCSSFQLDNASSRYSNFGGQDLEFEVGY